MKILKIIGITLVAIIGLILIVATFLTKDFYMQREITINKPKQEVYDYVKFLKNQDNFSKWAKMDPNMKKEYKGTDATVGFVAAWDSENGDVGKGEQEIKKITEGEKIDYELRFIRPFEGISNAALSTTAVGDNQTKVIWSYSSHIPYPMNIMTLCMEGMMGKDLDTGLNNLKNILEKK